jgi:hypothetical protein
MFESDYDAVNKILVGILLLMPFCIIGMIIKGILDFISRYILISHPDE